MSLFEQKNTIELFRKVKEKRYLGLNEKILKEGYNRTGQFR